MEFKNKTNHNTILLDYTIYILISITLLASMFFMFKL